MKTWAKYCVIAGLCPVSALAQVLTSINPDTGQQSQSLTVTILGQNTHFAQGSGTMFVRLAQGSSNVINTRGVSVTNDTSLIAEFDLPSAATTGLWNVEVRTSLDGLLTLENGFTINLGAPTNLIATAVPSYQINLSWRDNSGTAQRFKIERRLAEAGTFQQIAIVGGDTTFYADVGLPPQTQYCYRVRAFEGSNHSAYSSESCATTLTPPRIISVIPNQGEQSQSLTVTILGENTRFAPGSATTGVWFMRGNSTLHAASYVATSNASLNANFNLPSTAEIGLWSVNVQNIYDSLLTLQDGFTINLGAPTNLNATTVASTLIDLSWVDRSGIEAGFKIERRPGTGATFQQIAIVGPNITSFRDTGLTPLTQYCYRVRAFSGASNSSYSNEGCATTLPMPTLTSVNPIRAEQGEVLTVVIIGQNTHFAQGNATPRVWLAHGSTTIDATSTSVQSNTELRSNFNIPFSAPTGLWNLSVQSSLDGTVTLANGFAIMLAAPSQLLATGISSRQIKLGWQDNSGTEQGYRLERKRDGASAYEEVATVAVNTITFTDDSLDAATIYCYRVRAFDVTGVSNYSNESCDTTAVASFVDISEVLPGVREAAAAWGDFDNDGDLDFLLCGDSRTAPNSKAMTKIYRNENGKFVEHPTGILAVATGSVAWGDYDNDNDLDILLTGNTTPESSTPTPVSKIYGNRNGNFIEIQARLPGVWGGSASWGDFDNDGDLDIVLSGLRDASVIFAKIYRREASGFVPFEQMIPSILGSVAWGDYDLDGDLDLLMAGRSGNFIITRLLRNEVAANQGFVEIQAELHGVFIGSGSWADYDNDGDLDILLNGYDGFNYLTVLYQNNRSAFIRSEVFIPGSSGKAAWGDYDNDGDLDLLLAGTTGDEGGSRVYRNDKTSFVDINPPLLGIGAFGTAVWGDYDNDRDLDILLAGDTSNGAGLALAALIYRNVIAAPNTPPETPGNLSAVVSGSSVSFTWDKSQDLQTAQASLTYNLRVGTYPGGQNVVASMANLLTGNRLVPQPGNTGHRNSWALKNFAPGTYYWSVQAIDHGFAASAFAPEESLRVETSAVAEESADKQNLPTHFALSVNYPNPFNPSTSIQYAITSKVEVRLEVFDHLGRRVRTLIHADQSPGQYTVTWDGRTDKGELLPSGIYFYRLTAGTFVQTKKMLFLK